MAVSIAIIGINGVLGRPVLDALASDQFKLKVDQIKVITRSEPKQVFPGVDYVIGDISNPDEASKLAQSVGSVDVVLSLVPFDPTIYGGLEAFLTAVKPQLYIPSEFSGDADQVGVVLPGSVDFQVNHAEYIRKLGVKVVVIYTGLFHEPGKLPANFASYFGIDLDGNVIQRGDPATETTLTSVKDLARVLASVATFSDYSELPDVIRVESDRVTYEDVQMAWSAFHGKNIKIVKSLTKEEALREAQDYWKSNGFHPSKLAYYLHSLSSQGPAGGMAFAKVDNDLVNPGIWEWEPFQRA